MGLRVSKDQLQSLMSQGATLGPSVKLPEPEKPTEHNPGGVYRIVIPNWRPPTLNQLMRGKVKTQIALSKACKAMVAGYGREVPRAGGKRKVSLLIELEGRQKEMDADAPWKGLLDALVFCGLLIDDHSRYVQFGEFEQCRGASQTVITLEDV